MMMIRASSLEAVNRSWTLVAAFTLIQFTNVREATGKGERKHRELGDYNHLHHLNVLQYTPDLLPPLT